MAKLQSSSRVDDAPPAVRQEVLAVLRRFQNGPADCNIGAVSLLCDQVFVPPAEVDVDSFVLGMEGCEWCVGLEEFSRLASADWSTMGRPTLAFLSAVVTTEDDIAWLACEATISLSLEQGGSLGEFFVFMQQHMDSPNGAAIAELARLAQEGTNSLFETNRGAKYNWPVRLSGVLVKHKGQWRFQQIKFIFARKG